jgi:hypothetical protein
MCSLYKLNTGGLHGYPYKSCIGLITHCIWCYQWSQSMLMKVGFIRLPGSAHNNFDVGSRAGPYSGYGFLPAYYNVHDGAR